MTDGPNDLIEGQSLVDQASKIVDDYTKTHPILRDRLAESEFKPTNLEDPELHSRIDSFLKDEESDIPVDFDDQEAAEVFQLRWQVIEKLLTEDDEIRVLKSENIPEVLITRKIDTDDFMVEFCLSYGGPYHGLLQIYCQEPVRTDHGEEKYEISDMMSITKDSISTEHFDLSLPESQPESLYISLNHPSENFVTENHARQIDLVEKTLKLYLQS